MSTPTPAAKMGRIQQMRETYRMARRTDRWLALVTLGAFVLGTAVGVLVFWFMPGSGWLRWVMMVVGGLLLGVMAGLIVFGRRAQSAMYKQMEGQTGAAAGALQVLGRAWKVTPAIGFNKQQDVIHRAVGPPGIVLVGEGTTNRLRALMIAERRRHERVASETPIHEVFCGTGEGQVPLPKLVKHVTGLGRLVKPAEITVLLARLKAMDATHSNVPMPKGPVPTSMKGMRGNMRGR
jgi:Domain of unknown function (DUF4191)